MVLKGADGVVFVADSQKDMMEANLESLDNLRENLSAHDLRLEEVPLVMQYNKRDLEDALSIEEINETINTLNAPFYAAVATKGIGVEDTLKSISGLVMKSVSDKYGAAEKRGAPKKPSQTSGEDAPPVSREAKIRLNEKTDPFAAPLAVQAAASAGAEAFSSAKWEAESVSDPLDFDQTEDDSVAGVDSDREGDWPPVNVEPDMKPDEAGDNEPEDFDNLNLEDILDEALRVEEQKAAGESLDASPLEADFGGELGSSPVGESSAGILEEALGLDAETGPLTTSTPASADPFMESPLTADEPPLGQERSPLGQEEVDLLEDRFSRLSTSPVIEESPSLDELARTRIATDIENVLESSTPEIKKETTSPEVHASESVELETSVEVSQAHEVEGPIQLSISPDAEEVDLQVTLRIRINRKTNPED
jgi:hypothetical protein